MSLLPNAHFPLSYAVHSGGDFLIVSILSHVTQCSQSIVFGNKTRRVFFCSILVYLAFSYCFGDTMVRIFVPLFLPEQKKLTEAQSWTQRSLPHFEISVRDGRAPNRRFCACGIVFD